jgi:hypothetical protein
VPKKVHCSSLPFFVSYYHDESPWDQIKLQLRMISLFELMDNKINYDEHTATMAASFT